MYENVISNHTFGVVFQVLKRFLYIPKETFTHQKRPIKETCMYENVISNHNFGVVFQVLKRYLYIPKETYVYQKRPIITQRDR